MGVTDEGIVELVKSCVNLRTIDLTCCHLLTDYALSAIADSCKKLKCLKLESCLLITEKGFERLGTCCSLLQELDLTDCSINDSGNLKNSIKMQTKACTFASFNSRASVHLQDWNLCLAVPS